MKKLLIIVFSVLLISGCGSKEIICNKIEDENDMYVISHKQELFYKKDKLNSFTTTLNIEILDDKLKPEDFRNLLEEEKNRLKDEGFKTDIITKENNISLVIKSEGDAEEEINYIMPIDDTSFDKIKVSLKENDYKCE